MIKKTHIKHIKHDLKPVTNKFLEAENGYRLESAIKQFDNFDTVLLFYFKFLILSLYPFSAFIIVVCC